MGQPGKNCLHGEKSSNLSEISPALKGDLTRVGRIHSHINDLYYKLKYTILPRSHSGEASHVNGMIFLTKTAPNRQLLIKCIMGIPGIVAFKNRASYRQKS